MKHFLALRDYPAEELDTLLDRAEALRRCWQEQRMPQSLSGKRIALWFYGSGFRNRLAFELGAQAMGATIAYIPGELGVHEPIEDIAGYLQNWFSLLVLRSKHHADLYDVARRSSIPVINARTDRSHPCEIMADLLYVRQQRGDLKGLKVVFVGEASNLCMSWLEAAHVWPLRLIHVCPPGYGVSAVWLRELRHGAAGEMSLTHDLDAALVDVDLLYTDCWPRASAPEETEAIKAAFLPYQIQLDHLTALGDQGVFLPCPPVTRGEEVSPEAMASPRCKNHEAKDNLLHVQNAIMERLIGNAGDDVLSQDVTSEKRG